jgi:hypothetical protein
MDPTQLIGPPSPLGAPAPYWFIAFLKVLGFTLHMAPMHVWYAGLLTALLLAWSRHPHAGTLSARLMRRMPIIVAYGVNFGIVPLLFIQVSYYRVFYSATILMAWPWFSIVVLLTLAYYGIYIYSSGLRSPAGLTGFHQLAGWVASLLFIVIGFVFANGFSLMTNVRAWPQLWLKTSVSGAALGTALNTADPTFWPRWLMMFGLAITTTAAYIAVDAGLFASREPDDYKRWACGFAVKLYTLGIVWFATAGSWYVFGAWPADARQYMFGGPLVLLTTLTAVGPGLPWLFILMQSRAVGTQSRFALAAGIAQLGVLALNAVSRQVLQNAELHRFLDVTAEPVTIQWSPLVLFVLLLVGGLVVITWMVAKITVAERRGSSGREGTGLGGRLRPQPVRPR